MTDLSKFNQKSISEEKLNVESDNTIINPYPLSEKLINIENDLCKNLEYLKWDSSIKYVYNPLSYAKDLHMIFIRKYFENSTKQIIFLGINPGPWGMCQTGIPFGEKDSVKDWMKITGLVGKPFQEHPKRKIAGLDCKRSEQSGKKFWGLFKTLCNTPENFFKHCFVYNLCPFAFITESGRNITPDEIKDKNKKKLLCSICEEAFLKIIIEFNFKIVIAIGRFAEKETLKTLKTKGISNIKVYYIPHPSSRNAKNRVDWELKTLRKLQEYNLSQYFKNEN